MPVIGMAIAPQMSARSSAWRISKRMSEEYANLAALQPPAAVVLSAEDAKQFIGR
jgi:hypothetical protein